MPFSKISSILRKQIPEIVSTWSSSVRSDVRIKSSDDLSHGGLVDHVPSMLEELCDFIISEGAQRINITEARVHAYTRFRQGYRAKDLISETAILRLILHDRLAAILSPTAEIPPVSVLDSIRRVNLYIDEELRYAVAIFTEASPIKVPIPTEH